jgi:benzaldehyde dehydrogenase (NAD)
VLTGDPIRGVALAERVPAGMVHVNDQPVNDEPNAPSGGVGDSGWGRVGGVEAAVETFTRARWITVRAEIPWYPGAVT